MGSFRLDKGGRVNRDKPVSFRFNGRQLTGFEGDTIASALLANNVRQVLPTRCLDTFVCFLM